MIVNRLTEHARMEQVAVVCLLFALVNADVTMPIARPLWNYTWTDQLKHDLLLKYDRFARPSQQYNATHVLMNMDIRNIQVDEMKSVVTVNAWTIFHWKDDKLKWNSSDYGGQYSLHVAAHEIWQPDVYLYNSAQGKSIDHNGNTNCILKNDGEVFWVPPSQFFIFCDISLRKWPYDTHTCKLYFGSWSYSVEEINLDINTSTSFEVEMGSSHWEIISTKKTRDLTYYACCKEGYPTVDFEFTFHRRNPAYTGLVFVPALVCIALTLSVFWLPPTAGEKFLLSGITAVIITLLLIYFTQRLSVMTNSMPIIVEFYIYSLALVCLSLITSVAAVNISRQNKARPVPWGINKILTSRIGRLLQLPHMKDNQHETINVFSANTELVWSRWPRHWSVYCTSEIESFSKMQSSYTEQDTDELYERSLVSDAVQEQEAKVMPTNGARDWVVLAMAIDRLMFIAYIVIFTLLLIILFLT